MQVGRDGLQMSSACCSSLLRWSLFASPCAAKGLQSNGSIRGANRPGHWRSAPRHRCSSPAASRDLGGMHSERGVETTGLPSKAAVSKLFHFNLKRRWAVAVALSTDHKPSMRDGRAFKVDIMRLSSATAPWKKKP